MGVGEGAGDVDAVILVDNFGCDRASCSVATKYRMWDWDVSETRIFWAWMSIEVQGLFVVI